ncbi:MAG: isoprenylcysteine carboxylmethyltransferase family protein [Lentisphaerae bacterium]|nr:isoprenylcysteine carboxylmethyltransferase family protein [Lentisphaerota bacterium]
MNGVFRMFGVGPIGVLLSFGLFGIAWWCSAHFPSGNMGLPAFVRYFVLIVAGTGNIAGIIWSFRSFSVSQLGRGLCVQGAYRWVRHPLYASFISVGAPGFAIFHNQMIDLFWVTMLHLLWHIVVAFEEKGMVAQFGNEYLVYAKQTGRFIPRLWKRSA